MTSTTVSHPLFARCFHRLSWLIERDAAAHRRRTLHGFNTEFMSLGTGGDDVAARAPDESLGFSNRESNGALNFFYEREL